MEYVGLSRRLFAYILDGIIYLCLVGLSYIVFNSQSILFSETEVTPPVAACYLIISILYLIDQIALPTMYGFTVSRWICGYRIKRKDGDNPRFKQAVIRFFSIWLIELLTIGIITFITSFFRKDKAAIHDIISRSYAVFPGDRHRFKYIRLSIVISFICLGSLIFINIITYSVHDVFVKPIKNKILDEGYPLYPPARANKSRTQENGFYFYGIDLVKMDRIEDISICFNQDNNEVKEYSLKINGVNSIIDYTESSFSPGSESTWERMISLILKTDPFLDPPYMVAEKTYHNDDTKYPLFSPINNIALLTGNILYAIGAPAFPHSFHIVKGNKSFTVIQSMFKNNYYFLTVIVIREKNMELYSVRSQKPSELSMSIADRIIRELQVIEDPISRNEEFHSCDHE